MHRHLWVASCTCAFAVGLLITAIAMWPLDRSAQFPVSTPECINPNTAPLASLVRLPGIGRVRAMDIINYRNVSSSPVFDSAASLEEIKGIGPKTVEKLTPWLTFE